MARSMPLDESVITPPLTLDVIKNTVKTELNATRNLIAKELSAKVPLIQTITTYLIERGGKRLRPMLLLLAAQMTQSAPPILLANKQTKPVALAAVVEMIHSATLLHDDIVDESTLRRGQDTANATWGNAASVLAGDFLYSRAFQLLATIADIPISQCLADTTNEIAEGEMLQLTSAHDAAMTLDDYWQVIELKTATLFACACRIGAMASDADQTTIEALATFGLKFGLAYQIIDDTLDYQLSSDQFGKNRFNDLNEGKMTLPLILALKCAPTELAENIAQVIEDPTTASHYQETIYQLMQNNTIFEQCHRYAQNFIEEAITALNAVPTKQPTAKEALINIAYFILQRDY